MRDFNDYIAAFGNRRKMRDEEAWSNNRYTMSAIATALSTKKHPVKYIEKPFLSDYEPTKKPLTEEEKLQQQRQLLAMQLKVRQKNFELMKQKKIHEKENIEEQP